MMDVNQFEEFEDLKRNVFISRLVMVYFNIVFSSIFSITYIKPNDRKYVERHFDITCP